MSAGGGPARSSIRSASSATGRRDRQVYAFAKSAVGAPAVTLIAAPTPGTPANSWPRAWLPECSIAPSRLPKCRALLDPHHHLRREHTAG